MSIRDQFDFGNVRSGDNFSGVQIEVYVLEAYVKLVEQPAKMREEWNSAVELFLMEHEDTHALLTQEPVEYPEDCYGETVDGGLLSVLIGDVEDLLEAAYIGA